jgi:hypothetical protein
MLNNHRSRSKRRLTEVHPLFAKRSIQVTAEEVEIPTWTDFPGDIIY